MSRSYEVVDRNLTAEDLRLQARKVIGCVASGMHASKPNRISKGNQRLVDALDAGAVAIEQRDRMLSVLVDVQRALGLGVYTGTARYDRLVASIDAAIDDATAVSWGQGGKGGAS